MAEVFLFDLGGVLSKPIDDYELYCNLHCKVSYSTFLNYWWYDDLVIQAHKGLVSDEKHVGSLLDFCKSDITIDEFYKMYQNLDNSLYDRTVEFINNLKSVGYKVGILSNLRLMDFNRYKERLQQIGFDYYFLSYELKEIKPSKEIYQKVLQNLRCIPSDVVFFDDKLENVNAAKAVGMCAYLVTGNEINQFSENK